MRDILLPLTSRSRERSTRANCRVTDGLSNPLNTVGAAQELVEAEEVGAVFQA